MGAGGALLRAVRHDRAVALGGVLGVAGLAWAYLWLMGSRMGMPGMDMGMPRMQQWSAPDLLLLILMWAVMMVAMMLPSAAPMIQMFASIQRRRREQRSPHVATAVFVLGYLLIWSAFAAVAAVAQWGLHQSALLSPMMVSTTPALGGGLLIAAGVFQLTPLKQLCLTQCRTPFSFITTRWREGAGGALRMGMEHGTFCVGCCWMLMAILFVAGVMNLLWVAAIALFVLIEKVVPGDRWVSRTAGVLLMGWGAWVLLGGPGGT